MRARSHTATSLANLLNSRTWVSRSVDHLFTISSMVFPRSMDGGATATTGAVFPAGIPSILGAKDEFLRSSMRQVRNHTSRIFTFLRRCFTQSKQRGYGIDERDKNSGSLEFEPAVASFFSSDLFAPKRFSVGAVEAQVRSVTTKLGSYGRAWGCILGRRAKCST